MQAMRSLPIWIGVMCLVTSCDKLKKVASQTKETLKSSEVKPEYVAQVRRETDGVKFRKDLPFPSKLEVKYTLTLEFDQVRVFRKSALGPESAVLNQVMEAVITWQRERERVGFQQESAIWTPVQAESGKKVEGDDKPNRVELGKTSGHFRKVGGQWKAEKEADLIRMSQLQDMEETFTDASLMQVELLPRSLWFGSTTWKAGAKLTLKDEQMMMVVDSSPNSKGRLDLVFEQEEAVQGHPCARFSVTGSVSQMKMGKETSRGDLTVESGKLWFSLLHPLVLRSELDCIATIHERGSEPMRIQGHVIMKELVDWKPLP